MAVAAQKDAAGNGTASLPTVWRAGLYRLLVPISLMMALPAAALANPSYAEVAPLFAQHCVMCHAGATPPAGLRLDSYEAVLQGGGNGPVVKPGDPSGSELLRRLNGRSLPRMPMTGPPFLSEAEIALVQRWIAEGVPRGEGPPATPPPASLPPRPGPGEKVTYLHVAPILAARCARCHADNGLMGPPPEGYRLTSLASTLATTDRARVVPGNPAASELLRRIRGQARPRMPYDGPPFLDHEETWLIEAWIAQGARDAEGRPASLPVGARVRLHGRLEAGNRLDGLALVIGPGTRIDKHPGIGDYVQVRGRLDAHGNVIVERLRAR